MIHIHAVHMSGGTGHEHIASVKWQNPDDGKTGQNTKAEMVAWLRKSTANKAYVCGGGHLAPVKVVNASPPYIRSHADGVWTDNLLALPRF
jgi:hypothetical protein